MAKQENSLPKLFKQVDKLNGNNSGNKLNKQENDQILKRGFKSNNPTDAQNHIKDLLTNKLLFEEAPLDQTIFKTDLVIKLQVPTSDYIKRNEKMQLGSIVRKFPKILLKSYEAAYQQLYADMEQMGDEARAQNNNDKQLLIRQFASFLPLDKFQVERKRFHQNIEGLNQRETKFTKQRKVNANNFEEEAINLNCRQQSSGFLDAFTISYNTFIYSLQQFCGFKTKSFLVTCFPNEKEEAKVLRINQQLKLLQQKNKGVTRTIYILLYLPDNILIKAANKYHIKKQIDYIQVDPFLNDPMDIANRLIRYHSSTIAYMMLKNNDQKLLKNSFNGMLKLSNLKNNELQQQIKQASKQMIENAISDQANLLRKKIDRKIGLRLPDNVRATSVINETKMSKQQIIKYDNFKTELEQELVKLVGSEQNHNYYNDPLNEDALTPQQRSYLYLVNRGKVNLGVQKQFIKIKKQRKYFQLTKKLSKKYGYETFQTPSLYAEFRLSSKKNKFFNRLQKVLLYKQQIVSPYGEISLFNKMQKIKLAYLILKQHIRVQNLYMLQSEVFALTDEYQKFGKIGKKNSNKFHYQYIEPEQKIIQQIQGGLNGRNLQQDWHKIFAWKTNFQSIRNYLGQSKTYEIFIKTRLIQLFMILAPIGIGVQIVKLIIIDPNSAKAGYQPQFWFYISYMAIVTIIYGVFSQKYRRYEFNYLQNFVQQSQNIQFMNEYRGPYMRDNSTDNANTYNQKFVATKDFVKTYLIFLLFFIILFAQIGFYYGIRESIIGFSYKIPQFDTTQFQFLRPIQLIGYAIYFVVNALLYNYVVVQLAHWLTKFQNRPTKQAYVHSQNLKLFIFSIGIQIIGPIDLVFIQYAAKTSCSSDWCAKQIKAYVYCRCIIILGFSVLQAIDMTRRFLKNRRRLFQQSKKENLQLDYSRKLGLFLQFVYKESKKDKCSDINLVDQTVDLIHFATFLSIFPLAPAISLVSMSITYNIQRLQILNNQQRPIPKSESFNTYRKIVSAIGHWMLFFNFSHMFITLQWLQYLFPDFVLAILDPPSPYSLMTLKYAIILLFMVVYQVIMGIVMNICSRFHSIMDKRKWNMHEKHEVKILNAGNSIELKKPKPLHSISRTYNINVKRSDKNYQNYVQQSNNEAHTQDQINRKALKGSVKRKINYN